MERKIFENFKEYEIVSYLLSYTYTQCTQTYIYIYQVFSHGQFETQPFQA